VQERNIYESTENIHKYPLMRRMFHDPDNPITSPYVMWFDDDSFIRADASAQRPWLDAVSEKMTDADMVGAIYRIALGGKQSQWVMDQAWFNNQPVPATHQVQFATGGWWTIRADVLRRFDWPLRELDHRGGDVMLGELCRQQELRLRNFNYGVAINADDHGVQCKSDKRGYDSKPIGWHYDPGVIAAAASPTPPTPPTAPVAAGTVVHEAPKANTVVEEPLKQPKPTYFNPGL
jgi:hypothetical protein